MPESDMLKYRDSILNGPIIRTTLNLAAPIIVANFVNISYNLIDAFWLGKVGAEAFSAPTVSWPIIFLFFAIGMGLSFAGVTFVSQYVGAGEKELARKAAGSLLGFILVVSVIIATSGVLASPFILSAIGVPPDVYPGAVSYIRVIFAGMPIAFIGFAFISVLNGLGDTRTPTLIGVASSILNIVLDPILIFGLYGFPKLGVMGAAIATVLSRALVASVGITLLVRGFRGLKIGLRDLAFDREWLVRLIKVGGPLAIQQSANALGFTVMMSIVSRLGTIIIASYGLAIRIIDIVQAVTWGLMRATSIMIGQNVGAEKYSRAEEIVKKNLMLTTLLLSIGAALIVAFRVELISVFINNPQVIREGSTMLLIFTPSLPFFGVFFLVGAVARGSGHTLPFTIISIIRLWVLRIGLALLLSTAVGMGAMGIWVAMLLSNVGAAVMSIAWVIRGTWKKRVILISERALGRISGEDKLQQEPRDYVESGDGSK